VAMRGEEMEALKHETPDQPQVSTMTGDAHRKQEPHTRRESQRNPTTDQPDRLCRPTAWQLDVAFVVCSSAVCLSRSSDERTQQILLVAGYHTVIYFVTTFSQPKNIHVACAK